MGTGVNKSARSSCLSAMMGEEEGSLPSSEVLGMELIEGY